MINSLLGLTIFNTLLGIENVNRNAQQYAKQHLTDAKLDRILQILEKGEIGMHLIKYIEKIDSEIEALIAKEAEIATTAGERDLHYLFENRKHALKWAEEKGVHSAASYMEGSADNPGKNYFGGA